MQKVKEILLKIADKVQEEIFQPALAKLLRTYIAFAINSLDFSLTSLQEIVIRKNNSICVSLNSSFNASILNLKLGWGTRADGLLQSENIEEDQLMPSTHT